jgi:HK97 family phage portal protein
VTALSAAKEHTTMHGLPLTQRLALAWKALVSQFDAGSAQYAQQMLAGIFPASTGPAPARNAIQLLQMVNDSPWIRACAGRVADAKASTYWKLYTAKRNGSTAAARDIQYAQKAPHDVRRTILKDIQRAGELTEITDHIMLTALRTGSSALTGWDTSWLKSVYLDMNGEAFFLIQRNPVGAPVKFWIVPPHWVAETPTPKRPAYRLQWQAFQADVPEREMLWLKQPNAVEPYQRGVGLAKSVDDEVATDEYATKHTLKFFKNSARPDLLIMPKEGQFDKVERDRFEQWWNDKLQGFWRSFKPLFLHTPVEVKTLEQNFRNLQFTELRQHERDTIMQVWGIPPEMFGVVTSSNRSTIDQAPFIFTKYCIVPRVERERAFYQERLVPEYDERLILDYTSPVPEDKEFRLKVMQAQPSAFVLNEFRELAGLPEDEKLEGQYASGSTSTAPEADTEVAAGDENDTPAADNLDQLNDEEAAAYYLINRKLLAR